MNPLRAGQEALARLVLSHGVNRALSLSLAASISLLKGDPMLQTMHRLPMQRQGFRSPPLPLALQM